MSGRHSTMAADRMPGPASGRRPGRILLVDDHPGIRGALRQIVDADPRLCVVGETGTGLEALRLVDALRPDLVVLDVHLPGIPGSVVAHAIHQRWPDLAIVFLTMEPDAALRVGAGMLGAKCLAKETAAETLIPTIHAALLTRVQPTKI